MFAPLSTDMQRPLTQCCAVRTAWVQREACPLPDSALAADDTVHLCKQRANLFLIATQHHQKAILEDASILKKASHKTGCSRGSGGAFIHCQNFPPPLHHSQRFPPENLSSPLFCLDCWELRLSTGNGWMGRLCPVTLSLRIQRQEYSHHQKRLWRFYKMIVRVWWHGTCRALHTHDMTYEHWQHHPVQWCHSAR